MSNIPIPQWEIGQLDMLQRQHKLSTVSPDVMAVISLAESSGQGSTFLNSSGYGGYFGLSPSDISMWGLSGSEDTQLGTQAFDTQAQAAAAIMNQLGGGSGGNPITAERQYQGGSNEGASLMQQYGITGPQTGTGGKAPKNPMAGTMPHGTLGTGSHQSHKVTQQQDAAVAKAVQGGPFPFGNLDPLNWPFNAGETVVAFAGGLLWNIVARTLLVLAFLVLALILTVHAVNHANPELGKMAGKAVRDAMLA